MPVPAIRTRLPFVVIELPAPLHLGGEDDVSRYDLAIALGADPARIERAHTTPDRAPNVSLDSSCAGSAESNTCCRCSAMAITASTPSVMPASSATCKAAASVWYAASTLPATKQACCSRIRTL